MQYLRFSAACLSALACLGAGYPDARPTGARLIVVICAPDGQPAHCGPRAKVSRGQLGVRFPTLAKRAGIVSAPSLSIKCPGTCEASVPGARRVTITAKPTQDPDQGSYAFDHWEGSCNGQSTTSCTLRVGDNRNVRAVAVFRSAY